MKYIKRFVHKWNLKYHEKGNVSSKIIKIKCAVSFPI